MRYARSLSQKKTIAYIEVEDLPILLKKYYKETGRFILPKTLEHLLDDYDEVIFIRESGIHQVLTDD